MPCSTVATHWMGGEVGFLFMLPFALRWTVGLLSQGRRACFGARCACVHASGCGLDLRQVDTDRITWLHLRGHPGAWVVTDGYGWRSWSCAPEDDKVRHAARRLGVEGGRDFWHANAAFDANPGQKMDPTSDEGVDPKETFNATSHPVLDLSSVQFQQVGEHLIHIAFPFRNVGNGENGIDAVVAAGIDGFDKKAVDLKNAEDVSVFDDALREANAVVPHVGRLLIEGKPIESIEFHSGKDVVVQCLFPLRNGIAQGFNRRHIHVYFVVMTPDSRLHLVECPRDAIQGWPHPITTEDKLAYYGPCCVWGLTPWTWGALCRPKRCPPWPTRERCWRNWRKKEFGTKRTPGLW